MSAKQEKNMRKYAFTLAEVLITLTIIGVIAALTIPNLSRKWSDHADVVKVKEAYSILSNAMRMAIQENGSLDDWKWPRVDTLQNDASRLFLMEKLEPYLKVEKSCKLSNECTTYAGYYAGNKAYRSLKNEINSVTVAPNTACIILINGMNVCFDPKEGDWIKTENRKYSWNIGYIVVDINGQKGPNRYGYDVFLIGFNKDGISQTAVDRYGNLHKDSCSSSNSVGKGCSRWIMKHNNVDYKYRDVSAEW